MLNNAIGLKTIHPKPVQLVFATMPQFVIAYDISDDKRRERVARVLLAVGERVQKSVFTAYLDPEQQRDLRRDLGVLLRKEDALEWFPIDARELGSRIAWMDRPSSTDPVLVVS